MADETKTPETESPEADYIAAIKELKETTVPRDQYAKLKEENKRLLQSVLNGEQLEGGAAASTPDVAELRKALFNGDGQMTNLEYVTKTLELRDQLISEGKPDPFLPVGHNIAPTNEDIEAAERVAKVLKDCVDYADGDSSIFTSELQRVMVDTAPRRR